MSVRWGVPFRVLTVALMVTGLAACKRELSPEGTAWLEAVEREIDHAVSMSVAVCKPERGDAAAGQAMATTSDYKLLLDDQLVCVNAADCEKPGASDRANAAESQLAEEPRRFAATARETLTRLLAEKGNPRKTRAQVAAVLADASAAAEAGSQLVRVCGSPSRQYDMSGAMTRIEEARAAFRSSIKAMRADP